MRLQGLSVNERLQEVFGVLDECGEAYTQSEWSASWRERATTTTLKDGTEKPRTITDWRIYGPENKVFRTPPELKKAIEEKQAKEVNNIACDIFERP